jgi:hypothetical protein
MAPIPIGRRLTASSEAGGQADADWSPRWPYSAWRLRLFFGRLQTLSKSRMITPN